MTRIGPNPSSGMSVLPVSQTAVSSIRGWLEAAQRLCSRKEIVERLKTLADALRTVQENDKARKTEAVFHKASTLETRARQHFSRLAGDELLISLLAGSEGALKILGLSSTEASGADTIRDVQVVAMFDPADTFVEGPVKGRELVSPVIPRSVVPPRFDTLRDEVIQAVRARAVAAAGGHIHRDSPFIAVGNLARLVVRVGPDGSLLDDSSVVSGALEIPFLIAPDQNRLLLDPAFKAVIEKALEGESNLARRAVLEGLLLLCNSPLISRTADVLQLAAGGDLFLPAPDRNILHANISYLNRGIEVYSMTVRISGPGTEGIMGFGFYLTILSLDSQGRIVGIETKMPDYRSPRGTRYRQGLAVAGDRVPAVFYHKSMVWMGSLGALNPEQQSALLNLFDHFRTEREAALIKHPYTLAEILNEGLGPMALDVAQIIDYFIRRQQLTPAFNEYNIVNEDGIPRIERKDHPGLPKAGTLRIHMKRHPQHVSLADPICFQEFAFVVSSDCPWKVDVEELLSFVGSRLLRT